MNTTHPTDKSVLARPVWMAAWLLLCILLSACALTDLTSAPVSENTPARPPASTAPANPTTATGRPTDQPTLTPEPLRGQAASPFSADPQIAFAQKFDGKDAYEFTRFLTSAELAGRKAGAAGGDKAADYIAQAFKAAGLKPVGDNNTYFQSLTLPFIDLGEPPTLKILNADGSVKRAFQFRADFRESGSWLSSDGHAEGPLVFLGRAGNRDMDLAGDLKGKIALILPPPNTPVQRLMDAVSARGITGLIAITGSADGLKFKSSYIVGSQRAGETRALLVVSRAVADDLLSGSGATLRELEDKLNRDGAAFAATPNRVAMTMRLASLADRPTRNVIGVIAGSDPALANEVVMVGGHYDHVGADPGGILFQGANDNASGTAVVMALAAHFAQNNIRLKRTIVFAAWTAEESGLVGSKYYVEHPIFPLKQTIAYINLDVVGAGEGQGLTVTNDSPSLGDVARASAKDLGIKTGGGGAGGGSDHESFLEKGVRSTFFIWQNYGSIHTPDDTFDQIDVNKLKATGQVAALTLLRLAQGQ
ncbi:MAG: M20/M25/M40 family metallo-hydrolase [Chloroflexi bacterium]|nr:M20/M25/M40 family metallo-hydrolase [Chloroflexota bacterium]